MYTKTYMNDKYASTIDDVAIKNSFHMAIIGVNTSWL